MYSSTTARRMADLRSSSMSLGSLAPWRSMVPSASQVGRDRGPKRPARLLLQPERLDEGLLRDLHPTDVLHPLLALFLLLEELALAGDVAAVALGQHVLALGLDRLPGDDPPADG